MTVGQMIKLCRKEMGLTQSELAELIGVSMQAVSKWETDAGLPDISQLVPLAKVLHVSTDKLLGMTETDSNEDVEHFREYMGRHNISFRAGEAEKIYNDSVQYFLLHPTNPEIAFLCLESVTELFATENLQMSEAQFLAECERYKNCIFRYETNADHICKTYYVMSRVYALIGEDGKSNEMLEKVPTIFGDRTYWEAEFAYVNKNMELALQKCKESFAVKARYISRCIRLARMISESKDGREGLEYQVKLNEYMLNIINAFLSGGDYIPDRQMFQKTSLLCLMVSQYTELGNAEKALDCTRQLIKARSDFYSFLEDSDNRSCLMFPGSDPDGDWYNSYKEIDGYVTCALDKLKSFPEYQDEKNL